MTSRISLETCVIQVQLGFLNYLVFMRNVEKNDKALCALHSWPLTIPESRGCKKSSERAVHNIYLTLLSPWSRQCTIRDFFCVYLTLFKSPQRAGRTQDVYGHWAPFSSDPNQKKLKKIKRYKS